MNWFNKKRIYLDYAAATPVRKEVQKLMVPYQSLDYGNPGAIHREGKKAKVAVETARESVARTLRVRADNIIFTSGGTESNNLTILGVVKFLKTNNISTNEIEIISTKVEHPSILKVLEMLELDGVRIKYAPIDEDGRININEFEKLLSSQTRLVTFALANSETGVVQDITRIGRTIRAFEKLSDTEIIFHTDAAQAPLWLQCALDSLYVDMLTIDAGKCGGPKGVGILACRKKNNIKAITAGGSQEYGLRPGTEPVALVVGAAKALELAQREASTLATKVSVLRDRFLKELMKLPGVVLNGSIEHRLPNNVNISVPGFDTEYAVVVLDNAGIAASTKSACSGAGSGRSTVISAMNNDVARAASTIRFTLSPLTTWSDLKKTTNTLKGHLEQMKPFDFDLT